MKTKALMNSLIFGFVATLSLFFGFTNFASAKNIQTNEVYLVGAPEWLTQAEVEKATDRVTDFLEHNIKKVLVRWIEDPMKFEALHSFGPTVRAFTKKDVNSIFLGPKVKPENFEQVFAHELGHIVIHQKYKGAIPNWLEEGLANVAAGRENPDYGWLMKQKLDDVRSLNHPFDEGVSAKLHYHASTALALMLKKKCDLHNLLQMSVKKSVENYLRTMCEIQDLTQAYRNWITFRYKVKGK